MIMKEILEEVHKFCGCVCKLGSNCAEDECAMWRIEQLILKKKRRKHNDNRRNQKRSTKANVH